MPTFRLAIGVGLGMALGLCGAVIVIDGWRSHVKDPQQIEFVPAWDWPWYSPQQKLA